MLLTDYLCSLLLLSIHSVSATGAESVAVPDSGAIQHKPVDLEFGKEYTQSELQSLFEAQSDVKPERRALKDEPLVKESGAFGFGLFRRLSLLQSPLVQASTITFSTVCRQKGKDDFNFITQATYNGKNVHWEGHQNIDGFGPITIGGGRRGSPITSRAEFYHSACRAIEPTIMCSYSYKGTMLATVNTHGDRRGIDIFIYTIKEKHQDRWPVVLELCHEVPAKGTRSCPRIIDSSSSGLSGLSGSSPTQCQYMDASARAMNSTNTRRR